jgi:ElaA protein
MVEWLALPICRHLEATSLQSAPFQNTQQGKNLSWRWVAFENLTPHELYALLALRQRVFVIEQNCPYDDIDGCDPACLHLLGENQDGQILASVRVVPPGVKYTEPSIGRVVVSPEGRGLGLGKAIMQHGIAKCGELYPSQPIRIGAQRYLERFYTELGFATVSNPYEEDGIWHVEMLQS